MAGIELIQDLGIVLIVAGAAGWFFHRLGLSVVVGYILAGIIIGPYTPPFPLVDDIERVQTLANVGLVFLMFSIGMGLSLNRLRRLGFPLVLAAFLIAFLLFNFWRSIGLAAGLTAVQALFFAGMWVSSSSAIIGKVLQERGFTHRRHGQLALGVTVLEDIVAVVVLTLLLSQTGMDYGETASILETIGLFAAFVIFLAITGLLMVPRLLSFMGSRAGEELQTVVAGALLMLLAVFAYRAGYSLALGAFLMGAIVAETSQRKQVENAFAGLRHVFSAVFFVAMGMLINVSLLREVWPQILAITFLIIFARAAVTFFIMVFIGISQRDSIRAGLALTPMGEFGFIIAQAGIAAALLPETFFPVAVGVSLLTALVCPLLVNRSESIARKWENKQPAFLRNWITVYQNWLERFAVLPAGSILWTLLKKRLLQTALGILFVTGLLFAAESLYEALAGRYGEDLFFPRGMAVLFWGALAAIVLLPLFALWRNLSAMAMILGQATGRDKGEKVLPFIVESLIKWLSFLAILFWLWALLPLGPATVWVFGLLVAWAFFIILVFRRKLIFLHGQVEVELMDLMAEGYRKSSRELPPWLRDQEDFQVNIAEHVIPDNAECGGKTVGALELRNRLGCSIVGIDRHGYVIGSPGPQTILYPGDRLLLIGGDDQIEAARRALSVERPEDSRKTVVALDDVQMERIAVPLDSPRTNQTLAQLRINQVTGVQVAGIQRGKDFKINPMGEEIIRPSDELLVLGSPPQIKDFQRWLTLTD